MFAWTCLSVPTRLSLQQTSLLAAKISLRYHCVNCAASCLFCMIWNGIFMSFGLQIKHCSDINARYVNHGILREGLQLNTPVFHPPVCAQVSWYLRNVNYTSFSLRWSSVSAVAGDCVQPSQALRPHPPNTHYVSRRVITGSREDEVNWLG